MPIHDASLETRFIVADATISLDGLRQLVHSAGSDVRYVILRFPDGHFSVPTLYELAQAAYLVGPTVLDRPLADLPPAVDPAGVVDQTTVPLAAAKLERDRQPRRRLVVVRGDQPVGLLTNENRGQSGIGVPLGLHGVFQDPVSREELQRRLKNRVSTTVCPFCSKPITFYEVRAGSGSYHCPKCAAAQTP